MKMNKVTSPLLINCLTALVLLQLVLLSGISAAADDANLVPSRILLLGYKIYCNSGHLDNCLDEYTCDGAGGYWYNSTCNSTPEPVCDAFHLNLCLTSDECNSAGGSWYDSTCNAFVPMGFVSLTSAELAALTNPSIATFYYTTDTHILYHWNGTVFIEINGGGAPMAETPTFNPPTGTYEETQTVSISTATPNATIYYTTDGSKPTDESTVYTETLTIEQSTTLRAIAIASQYQFSNVGQAVYTVIGANRIDFSTMGSNVTMKLSAPGATVTWNWSDSTTYNGEDPGTKAFGTSTLRDHFVTIDPPSALVSFGNNGDSSSAVTSITGLGKFPHLHLLYLYRHTALTTLDVEGCTEINRLHLIGTNLTPTSCDNLLISLAAQNIPYNNPWGSGEWYPGPLGSQRTSASDAAVSTLSGLGWPSL